MMRMAEPSSAAIGFSKDNNAGEDQRKHVTGLRQKIKQ